MGRGDLAYGRMGRVPVRPDIIVTWPESCDYPLWRRWLASERERFAQVIVAFSPAGRPDLREHVRSVTPDVTFLDTRWEDGRDWRDAAVNAALRVSDADWVWFTEQDFLVEDPRFWSVPDAFGGCMRASAIGTRQGEEGRWHPCCLFVRRTTIDLTSHDFSVTEDGDHFARFGRDLEALGARVVDLDYWSDPSWYSHMAGLSHNHSLVERGWPVTYKPDEFARYLLECLGRRDDLDAGWVSQAAGWLERYSEGRG